MGIWKITLAAVVAVTIGAGCLANSNTLALAQDNGQECQKTKADKLAQCLSEATDGVQTCQSGCKDDPDDPSAYNECRRVCSEVEQEERAKCFEADKQRVCP